LPAAAQITRIVNGANPDTLSSDRKQQRQHGARQREALKPLQQRVRRAEQALERLQTALAECQRRLQDESLYQTEQRKALSGLLQEEGQLRQAVADAEEAWLDAQLELETQREVPNTQA
jgi:ATP-binding cassette subfamily F protein 3